MHRGGQPGVVKDHTFAPFGPFPKSVYLHWKHNRQNQFTNISMSPFILFSKLSVNQL